jgi:hypothetical protein
LGSVLEVFYLLFNLEIETMQTKEAIDYCLIAKGSVDLLTAEVKNKLDEGWKPLGQAFYAGDGSSTDSFVQTMIKYKAFAE